MIFTLAQNQKRQITCVVYIVRMHEGYCCKALNSGLFFAFLSIVIAVAACLQQQVSVCRSCRLSPPCPSSRHRKLVFDLCFAKRYSQKIARLSTGRAWSASVDASRTTLASAPFLAPPPAYLRDPPTRRLRLLKHATSS